MKKVEVYLNQDNMPDLVAEDVPYEVDRKQKFCIPDLIYDLSKKMHITEMANEHVLLLILDRACHVIAVNELSIGTVSKSAVSPREIIQIVLLSGGTSCIILHNHPSGDTTPSEEDILVTKRLSKALKMVDLNLLDHIIVGRDSYTSMNELDYII